MYLTGVTSFYLGTEKNLQIKPQAQGGAEGSVRLLLTKYPARSFSCPGCQVNGGRLNDSRAPGRTGVGSSLPYQLLYNLYHTSFAPLIAPLQSSKEIACNDIQDLSLCATNHQNGFCYLGVSDVSTTLVGDALAGHTLTLLVGFFGKVRCVVLATGVRV